MLNPAQAERLLNKLPIRHRESHSNVPFIFNPNQKILQRHAQQLYDENKPLWIILLKSRRVGGSAWADAILTCHCIAKPQAEALIVAHQYTSSKALFSIPKGLVGGLPFKIPLNKQHEIEFPHPEGNSFLKIATAGSMIGGRGLTLSALHLSEAAFYPGEGSFLSLIPAVSYDPTTILIIESTANGKIGPGESFYNYWKAAEEGRNQFLPVFLCWLDDPACFRHPDEVKDAPIDPEERELVKVIKRRGDHTDAQMRGRLAWRRWAIETQAQGSVEFFNQEYPTTPEEAFISTGEPAFEKSELSYARSTIRKPLRIGGFERDPLGNPVFIVGHGDWKLWAEPTKNDHYYIGVDCARGEEIGESGHMRGTGDFASACVWCGETGEQVATLTGKIGPETMADELDKGARYYNKAMVSIELTGNLGLWTQARLRDKYNYSNLYRWKGKDDKARSDTRPRALGWETTGRTRDLLFAAFRDSLRGERSVVRSGSLLSQMEAASRQEGFRWEVLVGHDDELIAAMIGWVALEQWAPPRFIGGSKPKEEESEQLPIQYKSDHIFELKRHYEKVMNYTKHGKPHKLLEGI